jgi:multiple sugar transport system permease protein
MRRTLYHAVLWAVALLWFLPVAWIILSAFKTREDILASPPKLLFQPTLANFADLFNRNTSFVLQFANSVILSIVSVVIAVAISFLAAYAFSRFKPRGTTS